MPSNHLDSASPPSTNRRGWGFGRRVVSLFLLLGLVLALIAVQVYRAIGDFVAASAWVTHTVEVKQEITASLSALRDVEANQRAYLIAGSHERLADYYAALPRVAEHVMRLAALVKENTAQSANVDELRGLLEQRLGGVAEVLVSFHAGGLEAARGSAALVRSRDEDVRIEALTRRMLAIEDTLLTERQSRTLDKAVLTRALTTSAILASIILLAMGLFFVVREQRRRLFSEQRVREINRELAGSLDESRRLGRTLGQLSSLGETLQACRGLDEAVVGIQGFLPRMFPHHAGAIALVKASQNLLETVAHWGGADAGAFFAPDECWALRRGQAYPPVGETPPFRCRHLPPEDAGDASHEPLCVPLIAQGEMLGILTLTARQPIELEVRTTALAAGEQLSMAIANLKLQETLRTQSLRDPLTGLFNRRYLEASLEREIQRATRRNLPLSLLMLDLDHFKRFNDSHGHDAGDALLAQFGALLARTVRSEDVACRYGGEEFTLLLPETDAEHALARANEICLAVRALDVQHHRQTLAPATVSIGVSTMPRDGSSPEVLLKAADRALYAAKRAGRDRAQAAA